MSELLTAAYAKHGDAIRVNLADRLELYELMDRDPEFAAAERALALKDILRFFKYHAWTHEPRPDILRKYGYTNPTLPFLLFPFQEDFVTTLKDHIEHGADGLVEKSRDMGISWLVVTVFLWFFLQPNAGNDFLFGSRKFEYVDKRGSQDTLFEKFRYNLYKLHPSILPHGFTENNNDNVGFISNPATGSFIRGESNNANFGTSGRYRAALMDEFSKWEETDHQAWTSMGDSSPCRIAVSTPWGLGRKFAQLRFSGAIKVLTLHWSEHPIKAAGLYVDQDGKKRSPWYDAECARRADNPQANIGQELDIDYLSSGSPYFDNELVSNRYKTMAANDPAKAPEAGRYNILRVGDNVQLVAHNHGHLVILEEPERNMVYTDYRYCISADVAEGLEKGDFDSCYVFDRVRGRDVAWYHGKMDTDIYAMLLYHLSVMYDNAYIAPENNNHGHAVIQKLKDLKARIMYEQDYSEWVDVEKVKLGWNTNVQTRPIMCADLREAVRQNVDGIRDIEFFNEAMTFILNKNGKPEAEAGCYDDRVMAQAIKFQLHAWLPAPKRKKSELFDLGVTDHGMLNPKKRTTLPQGARCV